MSKVTALVLVLIYRVQSIRRSKHGEPAAVKIEEAERGPILLIFVDLDTASNLENNLIVKIPADFWSI